MAFLVIWCFLVGAMVVGWAFDRIYGHRWVYGRNPYRRHCRKCGRCEEQYATAYGNRWEASREGCAGDRCSISKEPTT